MNTERPISIVSKESDARIATSRRLALAEGAEELARLGQLPAKCCARQICPCRNGARRLWRSCLAYMLQPLLAATSTQPCARGPQHTGCQHVSGTTLSRSVGAA